MQGLERDAIFAGRYRVVGCIAAGGMGAVYEVVHVETERRRALKVMHAHFVQSPELRDRFKREAKVAAQIDSEFVVDVFDAGIDEATQMPFLVMELLKGEELGKRLERVKRFEPEEAITYLWQTALALDRTHKANIVHRDLKPENLFLTTREDGPARVKVLDFGVAKFVAETGTQGATRSLGTPLYMSPEQFRSQSVTPASDVYALSLMAFTLLVGEAYWTPEASGDVDVVGFALKALSGPVESACARAMRRGVLLPPGFDQWLYRSAAPNPLHRPSSATDCIASLGVVFGLNPRQMTGLGASDPLLGKARSGSFDLPTGTLLGSPMERSAPHGGTIIAAQLQSAVTPPPATVMGVSMASPTPNGRSPWPIALGAIVVVAAMGGAAMFLVRARAEARSGGEATTPATATPTPTATATATATPTATATATATPTATAGATPGIVPQKKPPRSATAAPGNLPSTSAGYSQD